jgi:hypothetical protein
VCGHNKSDHDGEGGHCQAPLIDGKGQHVGRCPCPSFSTDARVKQ